MYDCRGRLWEFRKGDKEDDEGEEKEGRKVGK